MSSTTIPLVNLVKDGFGDWGFLVKYRMLSANEERGKYILTAFFQMPPHGAV